MSNPACPGLDLVLTYYSGLFSSAERERAVVHFSDCDFCRDALIRYRPLRESMLPEDRVLFRFSDGRQVFSSVATAKAAGVAEKFPRRMLFPEALCPTKEMALYFERDPVDCSLHIGVEGASVATRRAITLTLRSIDGKKRELLGEEIASGGFWVVDMVAAEKVYAVELRWDENRQ